MQSHPLFVLSGEEANLLSPLMLSLKTLFGKEEHRFGEEAMHHGLDLFMFELAAIAKKYRNSAQPTSLRRTEF